MKFDLPDPDSLPYWQHRRWGWFYEPDHPVAPAYRRHTCPITPHSAATAASRGAIALHAPGCTDAEWFEMKRLLIAKYDPAGIVPGIRFLRDEDMQGSSGGHNSTWHDKGIKL